MIELLKKIYPLRLAPNSFDTDTCVEILKKELPFTIHEYVPGRVHNGWTVPHSWNVKKAEIRKDGKLIYDAFKHPLGVKGYSQPFTGVVSLDELLQHVTVRKDFPDEIGYHCDYFYKPWLSDWGISMPYSLCKTLQPGKYEVDIDISFDSHTMKVCDFFIPGKSEKTIVLNAHNCHAAQANDDIAGVVVGVALMKQLQKKKNKLSYRLIIAPEHLGTVFYLSQLDERSIGDFYCGIFLEMLGNDNRFALQESFNGDHVIDEVCKKVLVQKYGNFVVGEYRKIVGNDESVWEAPGIEVPMVSLSRSPYKEYHTSADNIAIIDEKKLQESVDVLHEVIDVLETNCVLRRCFNGLVALSNPQYDLYISPGTDPSISIKRTKDREMWYCLMDRLPRYFDEKTTILDIAIKHNLPYHDVYRYIDKFREKGLVEFVEIDIT